MLMMTLALTSFCKKDQQILIVLKSDEEAVNPFLERKMAKTKNLFMAYSLFRPSLLLNVMFFTGNTKRFRVYNLVKVD